VAKKIEWKQQGRPLLWYYININKKKEQSTRYLHPEKHSQRGKGPANKTD
jgi:hypothetical protein